MNAARQIDLLTREPEQAATWREVNKGNARFVELADGHYTRQKPGTNQATRPGFNFCLLLSDGMAAWCVWRPLPWVGRMDGLEAWECTLFRNVGARLSSDLIREATRATYAAWGWPPRDGLISAVGVDATKRRRGKAHPPGWCFRVAGWTERPELERNGKVWLEAPRPTREVKENA